MSVFEAVTKALKIGAQPKGPDLKATDMWLFLKQGGRYVKAWNLMNPGFGSNHGLQAEPGTPTIGMPRDSGTFEIHIRLKNFGDQKASARIEGQTVEQAHPDTHQGELIVTEYQDLGPGEEAVYAQTFPTWTESCDQRTWVRVGNERRELVDLKGINRHLTRINVEEARGHEAAEREGREEHYGDRER